MYKKFNTIRDYVNIFLKYFLKSKKKGYSSLYIKQFFDGFGFGSSTVSGATIAASAT